MLGSRLLLLGSLAAWSAVPVLAAPSPRVTPDAQVAQYAVSASREPSLSHAAEVALLRKRIQYVFILYQENRSFDSYFGTWPGADGLYSQPPERTPGFYQTLIDTDGKPTVIHPFRIGPGQFAADTDDVDHSHPGLVFKMDVAGGAPKMDHYALYEERKHTKRAPAGTAGESPLLVPTLAAKQFGELSMVYEDGDTIPILWRYANRFVLCDHIFQLMTGPSTTGALAIIGAQTGVTQWIRHPDQAYAGNGAKGSGVPVLNDSNPIWGSPGSPIPGLPVNPSDFAPGSTKSPQVQLNLTYATLPLTIGKSGTAETVKSDADPKGDLGDVGDDIGAIAHAGGKALAWGWYQEGFDREPTDPRGAGGNDASTLHRSYVTHHNGPQYFGYISNNPKMRSSLHGLEDFYVAVKTRSLPSQGGLFYVKGGRENILGLTPADPSPAVQAEFLGDDDHPGYSDAQIGEAEIAECVNAVAASPYWSRCAIIITWDDSEGDYDHVPPPIRGYGPDGSPISDGPRVPLLVISPYARVHAIDHDSGDHASVVKLADTVFGLTPLADLPDEKAARVKAAGQGIENAGPFDDLTAGITDLLGAFDPARLTGRAQPLPSSYAEVPQSLVMNLPPKTGYGWRQVGVEPTDYALGIANQIPSDFNPRPGTEPTESASPPAK